MSERSPQSQATPRMAPLARLPVFFALEGKRAAREGYAILPAGQIVGEVTSGTFSPTLGHPISMGYVQREFAAVDTALDIDIRGRAEAARVVKLPFYRRPK